MPHYVDSPQIKCNTGPSIVMKYTKWCGLNSGGAIRVMFYLCSRHCCKQGKHVRARRKGDQWSCLKGQLTNNISTRSRWGFPRKQDELILLSSVTQILIEGLMFSVQNNAIELTTLWPQHRFSKIQHQSKQTNGSITFESNSNEDWISIYIIV